MFQDVPEQVGDLSDTLIKNRHGTHVSHCPYL